MTKKEQHRRDVYLRWKYNHSLDEINAKLKAQNYCCAICKKKYNKQGELLVLAVDHWHRLAKLKVISFKVGDLWHARVKELEWIVERNKTRGKAIKQAKRILLRLSVRGLICWPCNGGLRHWQDNYVNMASAGSYLKYYQEPWFDFGIV